MSGKYRTIVADPPWPYQADGRNLRSSAAHRPRRTKDSLLGADSKGRYGSMSLDELAAIEVPAADDAHLYLWTTNAFMVEAHDLAGAWGFEPKTIITWVKTQIGLGNYFRNTTEHVVFAVRGSLKLLARDATTAFTSPRGQHSAKPDCFYDLVERVSPDPRLELFARRARFGWDYWGDQSLGTAEDAGALRRRRDLRHRGEGGVVEALDLFAGAGGWDEAARLLGFNPLGIEIDGAACATREAAGHRTLQGDVSALDPDDFAPRELIIASAPCPTFSFAGKGAGRHLTEVIVRCMHELAAGNDTRAARRDEAFEILEPSYWEQEQKRAAEKNREPDREKSKERARRDADLSLLVVEPLRWVLVLEPRLVALEQVPEVLGLWTEMATILGTLGYHCWTGNVEAERYGVPQTRERAILMADREGHVHPPQPTHQRYIKGEPPRHEHTLEGEILPWVSMAEALGELEGQQPSPAPTVSGGGTAQGGGIEVFAGDHARRRVRGAVLRSGQTVAGGDRAERTEDEPALSITSRADNNSWVYDRRQTGGDGTPVPPVPSSEPAPTLTANGLAKGRDRWTQERPSTAVNGDPRISKPGRHDPEESGSQQKDAIRVSLEEAAILQSFRSDYPFQGTKSQTFLQVGNAVPPALALPILGELLGIDWKPIQLEYLATYSQPVDFEKAGAA